jgi:oxygen-independent coproporphyrinogen-3 oxidase
MKIPNKLLNKYNIPTPRYTSYPPANYFTDQFDYANCETALINSNHDKPQNISFYVHIPFCPKLCFYCGCNTYISENKKKIRNYVNTLKKEILYFKSFLDPNRKVSQIHWGGGTPNYLPIEYIQEIMSIFNSEFQFIENAEIAIECHPGYLTYKYAEELIKAGFNRMSLGIQDFKADVLKAINRVPAIIPVYEMHHFLKKENNISVNLDFIYGLPLQSEKSFRESIEKAASISPDRLVTFSYAHVPWLKKSQLQLEKYGLSNAEKKVKLFEIAYEILGNVGYKSIGLDHFAKEDDELSIALKNRSLHRNFQGYCTRETTGQVYAVGVSGISQLEGAYLQNTKDIDIYIQMLGNNQFPIEKIYFLTKEEQIIREVINELMCNLYLDWNNISNKFNTSVTEIKSILKYREDSLQSFINEGLLENIEGNINITEIGKFFIRNIAANFDPKMNNTEKNFSKAI